MDIYEEEYTSEKRNGIFRFIVPNLDAHNKSLEWIESERKRMGAEIDNMIDDGYDSCKKCHIFINGRESGINYRLTINFEPKIANLLSKRINEIELSDRNLKSVLNHICLEIKPSVNYPVWPGDHIVSVMNCLSEDMTSVLDRDMRTLRKEMTKALVVSWFQGNSSESMRYDRVSQFVEWLADLESTDSEFSFANKRDLILKNIRNNWEYWEETQKTTQMKLYENVFQKLEDFQ